MWLDGLSIKHGDWCIWYQKGTNNKWTYNLTNHLMVNLDTKIALAFMTYIIDLNANELHLENEKNLQRHINEG